MDYEDLLSFFMHLTPTLTLSSNISTTRNSSKSTTTTMVCTIYTRVHYSGGYCSYCVNFLLFTWA